jgi:hypothetical protein
MRESHPYGDANCHIHADTYTYSHANGNLDADFDAKTDAHAEACADAKSSSHSGAETIEIFATAKNFRHEVGSLVIECSLGGSSGVTRLPADANVRLFDRAGSALDADFRKIVLTRFCGFRYKGLLQL